MASEYKIPNFKKMKRTELIGEFNKKIDDESNLKTGLGLKKRREIVGCGNSDEKETRKEFNGKYID